MAVRVFSTFGEPGPSGTRLVDLAASKHEQEQLEARVCMTTWALTRRSSVDFHVDYTIDTLAGIPQICIGYFVSCSVLGPRVLLGFPIRDMFRAGAFVCRDGHTVEWQEDSHPAWHSCPEDADMQKYGLDETYHIYIQYILYIYIYHISACKASSLCTLFTSGKDIGHKSEFYRTPEC